VEDISTKLSTHIKQEA